jgi:hypothetical protein
MDDTDHTRTTAKRTDVGYKRPPVEHQFRPGQKPPPRKKQENKSLRFEQLLTKILAEKRRLVRGNKAHWYSNAELLVEVAFQLAEKGNSTIMRALTDYLMASDKPEASSDEPLIEYDPGGPGGVFNYTRRVRV